MERKKPKHLVPDFRFPVRVRCPICGCRFETHSCRAICPDCETCLIYKRSRFRFFGLIEKMIWAIEME